MIFRRRRSKEKSNRITWWTFRYNSQRVATSSMISKITREKSLLMGRLQLERAFLFPPETGASRLFKGTACSGVFSHLCIRYSWSIACRFKLSISIIKSILSTIWPLTFKFLSIIMRVTLIQCWRDDDILSKARNKYMLFNLFVEVKTIIYCRSKFTGNGIWFFATNIRSLLSITILHIKNKNKEIIHLWSSMKYQEKS